MKKNLILLLLFTTSILVAQKKYDVAIYYDTRPDDDGAWSDGVTAFEHFLQWKGLTFNRVDAAYLQKNTLKDIFKVIYFPGGDSDSVEYDIGDTGLDQVRDFVGAGGGYLGICAGAELACKRLIWDGDTYERKLGLFDGTAVGPIKKIINYPQYKMSTFTMKQGHEINQFQGKFGNGSSAYKEDILYYGGSYYRANKGFKYETLATYDAYYDSAAVLCFPYLQGRVVFSSPHPEMEEDDTRDGVSFGDNLSDKGSDWHFLWTAMDWLMKLPVTEPPSVITAIQSTTSSENELLVFPNPGQGIFTLSLKTSAKASQVIVTDLQGRKVKEQQLSLEDTHQLDLQELEEGVYFISVYSGKELCVKKIVITN